MLLNIAILEDEEIFRNQLSNLLNEWATQTKHTISLHTYSSFGQLKNLLSDINQIHVFFLDIMLTNNTSLTVAETGLDVAKYLRQNQFHNDLIFLTSFREFVFDGYNVNAFNFLLKPIDKTKLFATLDDLAQKYSGQLYILKTKNSIDNIPYNEIIAFSSTNHETTIMTSTVNYIDHSSLNSIINHLPTNFIRCHRTCVVNIYHIRKIQNNTIYLSNNTTQSIGRKYMNEVKKVYMDHLTKGVHYL